MLLQYVFDAFLLAQCVHITYALDTVVYTPSGPIRGIVSTDPMTGEKLTEFRGIRYGKPPIGNLRFKKPEPVDKWTSEYDASTLGNTCPQIVFDFLDDGSSKNQSEDCLFLNVYVPKSTSKKLSVMVWIHGGGYMAGNANFYDGTRLAVDGDVIVVTINYRLGIFGFLALYHPAAVGNYGLWDQKLALQWVHDNIAAFGGNPGSVTIFGESAGGMSVSYHSLIPSNEGLFQRVIAQSGVVARIGLNLDNKQTAKILQLLPQSVDCAADNLYNFVECLRNVPVEKLIKAAGQVADQPTDTVEIDFVFVPAVDGELIPRHPIIALEDPNSQESKFFNSLDFVAGTTSQEGSGINLIVNEEVQRLCNFNVSEGIPVDVICQGILKPFIKKHFNGDVNVLEKMCKFYTSSGTRDDQSNRAADLLADFSFTYSVAEMLDFHARSGKGNTYRYQLSKYNPMPIIPRPVWLKGVGHGEDILFLFYKETDVHGNKVDTHFAEAEMLAMKRLILFWTSFAKTGKPTAGEGTLPWLEYDIEKKIYMDIDEELLLKQNLKQETVKLWSELNARIDLVRDYTMNVHDEL